MPAPTSEMRVSARLKSRARAINRRLRHLLDARPGADFDFLKSKQVPIFVHSDGRPVLNLTQGGRGGRVVVTSFPKAGTYFFGALLQALGYADVGIHVGNSVESGFEDHRFVDYEVASSKARLPYRGLAVSDYIRLTLSGQYFVGHIVWDSEHERAFSEAGVKVLVAVRNLRPLLVSHMRYLIEIDRQDPFRRDWFGIEDPSERLRAHNHAFAEVLLKLFEGILKWTRQQNVPAELVRFEDFNTPDGCPRYASANELERFLGLQKQSLSEDMIRLAQATKTLTRNDVRTQIEPLWNDRVEDGFISDGFAALNRRLGYA